MLMKNLYLVEGVGFYLVKGVGFYLVKGFIHYPGEIVSGVYFGILLNHWSYTLDATCAIITGGTLMPQRYAGFSVPKS